MSGPDRSFRDALTDDDPLSVLAYVSRSTFEGQWAEFMQLTNRILSSARLLNERLEVTGLLMVGRISFAQILEGPRSAVNEVFEQRVLPSTHHEDVAVLVRETQHERLFGEWAMAFMADRSGLLDRFVSFRAVEGKVGASCGMANQPPPCKQLLQEVEYLAGDAARSRVSSMLGSSPSQRPHIARTSQSGKHRYPDFPGLSRQRGASGRNRP